MRSKYHERDLDDDMTEKAGWMYADLFLGLMVIFLATISFVPELRDSASTSTGNRVSSNSIRQSTNYNFDQGLTIVATAPDSVMLSEKIDKFLKDEKFPADSQVIFVKFIGGYDSEKEDSSEGDRRALEFGWKMRADNPDLFANATTSADSSPDLKSGEVAIVLTFSAPYKK